MVINVLKREDFFEVGRLLKDISAIEIVTSTGLAIRPPGVSINRAANKTEDRMLYQKPQL